MKVLITIFLMSFTMIFASNPLDEYVTDEVYNQGVQKFHKNQSIFKPKVYSRANADQERKAAISRIKSTFTKISFISKNAMGNWITTFYYKNSEGRSTRKTIEGAQRVEIGETAYYITPYSSGLKIKELNTNYEYNLEKEGR
ncbi:MAG: hypothetical protein ACQERZ_01690 [Fusobacteriota bacterium]